MPSLPTRPRRAEPRAGPASRHGRVGEQRPPAISLRQPSLESQKSTFTPSPLLRLYKVQQLRATARSQRPKTVMKYTKNSYLVQ
jgi:hypothetical protein